MPPTKPIKSPAGYAPTFAIGYSDAQGELAIVDTTTPLPVALTSDQPISVQPYLAGAPAPLEGSAGSSAVVGPFSPVSGRPVVITLSGEWTGQVRLERSVDAGATRHSLTVAGFAWGEYSANACEPVWEELEAGAQLYLAISVGSGSVAYRLSQ